MAFARCSGIHTAGFPNLFIMGGYQASFQFNLTEMLQTQGRPYRRVHRSCAQQWASHA